MTIQCDASQWGLGAVESRALTPTECKYAQIENEMLAILYAYERFVAHIYGRDMVTIQSDLKPPEFIFKWDLCLAPKRL